MIVGLYFLFNIRNDADRTCMVLMSYAWLLLHIFTGFSCFIYFAVRRPALHALPLGLGLTRSLPLGYHLFPIHTRVRSSQPLVSMFYDIN